MTTSVADQLRIAALEPFLGGSHKAFLEGYRKVSRHNIDIFGLPARKWKWRMRGAALHFAEVLREIVDEYDLIFASDYLSLADLVALMPDAFAHKPKVVYFHENQLTYPVRNESERDYQYAFTNITTCLAADLVLFNSEFHRRSFVEAIEPFLRKMPDFRPDNVAETIAGRSRVLHFGVDFADLRAAARPKRQGPAIVLWNHRWEFDKNPEAFFETLFALRDEGAEFRVAVAGQRFRQYPEIFDRAREVLADRIVHFGYLDGREEYLRLLWQSDIIVSTAFHEFFGVSVVEGLGAGCYPILPNRLSYSELLPPDMHGRHLYDSDSQLRRKLGAAFDEIEEIRRTDLRAAAERFSWERLVGPYDRTMVEVVEKFFES